ncbi:hypothetical protein ISS42_03190 [Candidatus Shapirobacteria bacterium]|nr:hypothetical protein [Candidatus Shapirobacteria bacterium]
MKKKLLIGFLILSGLGLIGMASFYFSASPTLPFPLLAREKVKFSLSKELAKAEISLSQGLVWNEKLMSFEGLTSQGIKIIFSESISAGKQISSLQLILKKTKMIVNEESRIRVIDLRALDPYVSIKDN